MRKRIWQIHSWLGLVAGLGLLVIGLTGSVLVFRNDIQALVTPDIYAVQATPSGRLGMDELVSELNRQLPGFEVTGWLLQTDPAIADLAYVVEHGAHEWRVTTVNPYSGELLAGPMETSATLTGWLLEFHYTFLGDHLGMLIAGLFAVLLCLLGVTGVWLYRDFWKSLFTLRWGRSARIFFSDLHKMAGISSVGFNLVLGFTGAWWNLPHAVEHLISGEPEHRIKERLYADNVSVDAMIARSAEAIDGFQATYVSLPWSEGADFTIYGKVPTRNPLRSDYGSTAGFDAQTGELLFAQDVREAGVGAQIADAFYPLHFGNFGGLPVKILWCLAGCAPGVLAVSGFMIWFKRRQVANKASGAQTRVAAAGRPQAVETLVER